MGIRPQTNTSWGKWTRAQQEQKQQTQTVLMIRSVLVVVHYNNNIVKFLVGDHLIGKGGAHKMHKTPPTIFWYLIYFSPKRTQTHTKARWDNWPTMARRRQADSQLPLRIINPRLLIILLYKCVSCLCLALAPNKGIRRRDLENGKGEL